MKKLIEKWSRELTRFEKLAVMLERINPDAASEHQANMRETKGRFMGSLSMAREITPKS